MDSLDNLDQTFADLHEYAGTDEGRSAKIVDRVIAQFVAPHHRSVFWGDRILTIDKSAAFLNDPLFQKAFSSVNSSTGENQYASPNRISWRLHTLQWAAQSALHVEGDFIECGVFRGDMAWTVLNLADLSRHRRNFFLFDTFEGFSPRYSSPADFPTSEELYHRNHKEFSAPEIYDEVVERFSKFDFVKVVRGVVPDSLIDQPISAIAFLHLDMNSPAAEVGALTALYDRISPGGFIVFDDYGWILHSKQRDAADAFAREKGQKILELPTGQGLWIKPGVAATGLNFMKYLRSKFSK